MSVTKMYKMHIDPAAGLAETYDTERSYFNINPTPVGIIAFDDGKFIIEFGDYGARYSATFSYNEMREFVFKAAPHCGLSVTDTDELWEQEGHDA